MNWLTSVTTIISVCWLLGSIALLWLIWRSSERRSQHTQRLEQVMIEVATKDADSAKQAVEAVRVLAALLQNEQAKR